MSAPKLYGLMIAKDEADIIEAALVHALGHCTKIICMDNMSSDGTWDIMQAMAVKHPGRVIAHARIDAPFHDNLRAHAYNAFHQDMAATDWWLRLDADEFLHEHPARLISRANTEGADFIRAYQVNFMLTDKDIAAIEGGQEDRSQPIEWRRRYYRVNWREFRLFRNDPAIAWDISQNGQFPHTLSGAKVCSQFILNRHYGTRDITQLKSRIANRVNSASFAHVPSTNWRDYLDRARDCRFHTPGDAIRFNPALDFWPRRIAIELQARARHIAAQLTRRTARPVTAR